MYRTTVNELSSWLNTIEEFFITGVYRPPKFLKPFHLLTLAISAKRHSQGLEVLNILEDDLKEYADSMGLWEASIKEPAYSKHKRLPNTEFLPLEVLDNPAKCDYTADKLAKLAAKQGLIPDDSTENLWVILVELLGNYYSHSASEHIPGLVCAQSWPKTNLVQIAIADGGIGIRQSLQNNPTLLERLQTENACQLATQYGVTGKPEGPHSGYGLTLTRGVMQNVAGTMLLVSGEEAFIEDHSEAAALNLFTSWQGTLLVLEWSLDSHLDTKIVYDSWPSTELNEDEFSSI